MKVTVIQFPGEKLIVTPIKNGEFAINISSKEAKSTSYLDIIFDSQKFGRIKYTDNVFRGRKVKLFFFDGKVKTQVFNTGYP